MKNGVLLLCIIVVLTSPLILNMGLTVLQITFRVLYFGMGAAIPGLITLWYFYSPTRWQKLRLSPIKSIPYFNEKRMQQFVKEDKDIIEKLTATHFSFASKQVQVAITRLLALVQRDFVRIWYSRISTDRKFEKAFSRSVERLLMKLKTSFEKIDLLNVLATGLLPLLTLHFSTFKKICKNAKDIDEAQWELILEEYRQTGKLYQSRFQSKSESIYLSQYVDEIIDELLEPEEQRSIVFRTLCRDIVQCIIRYAIESFSNPDYLNEYVEYLIGFTIRELHDVKRFRQVLEKPFRSKTPLPENRLQTFDEFLESISECNNILDAQDLKASIQHEIEKRQNQSNSPSKDMQKYISRLVVARKKIERRIDELNGVVNQLERESPFFNAKVEKTLESVLKNTVGISCFKEYMRRQNKLMKIEFYLKCMEISSRSSSKEIQDIIDTYLTDTVSILIEIDESLLYEMRRIMDNKRNISQKEKFKELVKILEAMKSKVFLSMETYDWPMFCQSDTYLRYLNDFGFGLGGSSQARNSDCGQPPRRRNTIASEVIDLDTMESLVIDGSESQSGFDSPVISPETTMQNVEDQLSQATKQLETVTSMIGRSGLLGNYRMKILKKAKDDLSREVQHLTFQKARLGVQEFERVIKPGKCNISIPSCTLGNSESHSSHSLSRSKHFALYMIEIHSTDNTIGWMVARRYSEFYKLHSRLKEKFKNIGDLPGKKVLGLFSFKKDLQESRRVALEGYLQQLVNHPAVSSTKELLTFLCQQNMNMSDLESMEKSNKKKSNFIDDLRNSVNTEEEHTLLDALTEKLGDNINEPVDDNRGSVPSGDSVYSNKSIAGFPSVAESFCDLFIEIFNLNGKSNWLRRQAIILVLQQIIDGTIERKTQENIKWLLSEEMIVYYLSSIEIMFWPQGVWNNVPTIYNQDTKEQLRKKLKYVFPELFGTFVGRQNAKKGANLIFESMQNKDINKSIAYQMMDELVSNLFINKA